MRFLIKILFTALILVVVGLGLIVLLVPTDIVRDQVIAFIEKETGRKLTIAGETSLSFYPNVGISIEDVALSNPPGMEGGPMLRMATLNVNLALMPLLGRDVQVRRFVMVQPVFDLRIDRSGRPNWLFEKKTASGPPVGERYGGERYGAKRPTPAINHAQFGISPAFAQPLVRELRLDEVRIDDGIVQFSDARSGTGHRAEAVNIAFSLPRLSDPLVAEGDFMWRGEKVGFQGHLDALPALLEGRSSPLAVTLDTRLLKGSLNGTVIAGGALAVEGDLSSKSSSLRALANWLDNPLPPGKGLGPMSFAGHVVTSPDSIVVTKARVALDDMTGQGSASIGLAGAKPIVRAVLNLDKIDFNAYLGPGGEAEPEKAAPKAAQKPAPSPKPNQSLTDFIEDLNRADQGDAGSRRAPAGKAPGDLAALHAADAELRLTAGQVLYGNLVLGRSVMAGKLIGGVLTADLTEFRLYKGVGSGRFVLNGARKVPAFSVHLNIDGVEALPLLTDAMAFDWVSGKVKLSLNLSGTGRSQSELAGTLGGKGNILFTDGAIEGVNIPRMVRAIKNGQFNEWRRQAAQKTDFSRMSGSITILNGVAKNDDFELIGPLVRVTGDGTADLPGNHIDYRILPRLVASLQGQGAAAQDGSGLAVPLRLQGPLDHPRLRPDLQRLMEDPELRKNAVEQVGKAVESLKKGDAKKILEKLLGGSQSQQGASGDAAQQGQPTEQGESPKDLLKQLFRR